MDVLLRNGSLPRIEGRSTLVAALQFPRSDRLAPTDRVDVPEVEESYRVSFSEGAAPQAILPQRSTTEQAIAFYQRVQAL